MWRDFAAGLDGESGCGGAAGFVFSIRGRHWLAAQRKIAPALSVPTADAERNSEFQVDSNPGQLPPGLLLSDSGMISGTPTEKGEFPFVVSVTDSSTPPQQKSQAFVFQVVAPLIAEWYPAPKVNGRRIEGGIKVSNQTGHDFDLTVIVMAINENGRATAIGYQHVNMKDATELQIPVGESAAARGVQLWTVRWWPKCWKATPFTGFIWFPPASCK